MKTLIIYHSKYGQTEKIATRISEVLNEGGLDVERVEIREVGKTFSLEPCDAVVIGAPLYAGSHAKPLTRFVRTHCNQLNQLPTAFFSVSLSATGDASQREDATKCMNKFLADTGWNPDTKQIVAGALPYRRYGWFTRWLMKRIVRKAGGDMDTSRNYEYTSWQAVNAFARSLLPLFEKDPELNIDEESAASMSPAIGADNRHDEEADD